MGASRMALNELLESGALRGGGGKLGASSLLAGLGARLTRASELPPPERPGASSASPASEGRDAFGHLFGGLPKGKLVELVGRRSSGRHSLALSALATATSAGEPAALVDLGDALDPQAAAAAGVDLERLLWVRPTRIKAALAAAEMLLATGFPLVVADLGVFPRGGRFLPDAAWVRLARAAQAANARLLVVTPWRMSGIAAEAVVTADVARPVWLGEGKSPRLLEGVATQAHLEKWGRSTPGTHAPMRWRAAEAIAEGESRETGNRKRETRSLPPLPAGEGRGEGTIFTSPDHPIPSHRPLSLKSAPGSSIEIHGSVRVAAGPWSVEEAWWSDAPAERDYWDVELSDGGLYRVFRDRRGDAWFADGLYD